MSSRRTSGDLVPKGFAHIPERRRARLLRRAVLCVMITALVPIWPTPRPAEARGLIGFLSKLNPLIGVGVGLRARNRVYRTSNRFIRDRNAYYDGLLETARRQMLNREIMGVRKSQAAAYVKVWAMIQQERAGQLAVAEARKRQARAAFHDRLYDAAFFAAAGTRLAQELLGSMLKGVDSMEGLLDRAIGNLTGSDALKHLGQLRDKLHIFSRVSNAIGGKLGRRIGNLTGKVADSIDAASEGFLTITAEVAGEMKGELMGLREMLSEAKEIGRKPTAGDAIAVVSARFLPQSEPPGSIPLEAVASILSDLEVGDGSLKDEARKAINAGFVARCAEFSKGLQTQLNSLKKSGQEEAPAEGTGQTCRDLKPKRPGENAGTETTLDELLGFTEDSEEEQLPRVTASGSFSENVSGAASPSPAMGTTFQFTADFEAGTITGSLKGGRTSTPGGWMNCYELSNPSLEFERIDVETTDSYTASFSGAIDKENGEFSLALSPKGAGSSRKMQLFVDERCLDLNTKKYSGDGGWTGQGTISGGVSKDGGYELRTSWTYTRFSGEVQVGGTTSGNGIVSTPD